MATENIKITSDFIVNTNFLIIDNALHVTEFITSQLDVILRINDLELFSFKYEFVSAGSDDVQSKIMEHTNIIVATSFTTIKSNAVEDLFTFGVEKGLRDKNIFSIMDFSNVGKDFEDYLPEIAQLIKNNVNFYFISKGHTHFDIYIPKA